MEFDTFNDIKFIIKLHGMCVWNRKQSTVIIFINKARNVRYY